MDIARYKMIVHDRDRSNPANPRNDRLVRPWNAKVRMPIDGLTTLEYNVQTVELLPTHTRIDVLIDEDTVWTAFTLRRSALTP